MFTSKLKQQLEFQNAERSNKNWESFIFLLHRYIYCAINNKRRGVHMREFKSPDTFVNHYDPMESRSNGTPHKLWQFRSAENNNEIYRRAFEICGPRVPMYTAHRNHTGAPLMYLLVHRWIPGNVPGRTVGRAGNSGGGSGRCIEFCGTRIARDLPLARISHAAIRRRSIPHSCAARRRIPRAPFSRDHR